MQTNTFTFQGKLATADAQTTKAGKTFVKLQVRADATEKGRPVTLAMVAWDKTAERITSIPIGTEILIMGRNSSSEYQGRHYPELMVNTVYIVDVPTIENPGDYNL